MTDNFMFSKPEETESGITLAKLKACMDSMYSTAEDVYVNVNPDQVTMVNNADWHRINSIRLDARL